MNSENFLEKALYIFICDGKERLDKVYKGDKLMKKLIGEKTVFLMIPRQNVFECLLREGI